MHVMQAVSEDVIEKVTHREAQLTTKFAQEQERNLRDAEKLYERRLQNMMESHEVRKQAKYKIIPFLGYT